MRGTLLSLLVTSLAVSVALRAQTNNTFSTEVKQAYTSIKNNLTKAAEKMPEESYSFKASPDIRTFGALIGHVADAQSRACNAVLGQQKTANASEKTAKADLVAALHDSFADCDKAFDTLTDSATTEMVKLGRNEISKMGALMRIVIHDNEEYGYLAVYMRQKGVVPPSSDRK